jgi:hypothetical protein
MGELVVIKANVSAVEAGIMPSMVGNKAALLNVATNVGIPLIDALCYDGSPP